MPKPSVTLRLTKGSELTFQEGDNNFANLRDATITVNGDTGSIVNDLNGSFTVAGGTGLTTSVASSTLTVNLDNTAVTPGSYTVASITVDAQGRITSASSGTSSSTLNDLTDVNTTGVMNGHTLQYNSTASEWQSVLPQSGASTLNDLTDVQINGTPSSGQILKYMPSGQWENQPAGYLSGLGEDANPLLGGNLNVGSYNIISNSNGNINLQPNGTGKVVANKELEATLLRSTQSSGDEGGQLNLALAATNTTLSGEVAIDIHQNKLRIFETGGSNRGAYIDLSAAATSVGTNLVGGGGGISDIVQDTTPQLGGNLDVNNNSIVSVSNGNIVVAPNGTGLTKLKNIQYNESVYSLGTTSTPTINIDNGNFQTVTLNGNWTFSGFASAVAGQSVTIVITQDGTGSRTFSTSSITAKWAGGATAANKTLTTAANSIDILSIAYDGSTYYFSLSKGYE